MVQQPKPRARSLNTHFHPGLLEIRPSQSAPHPLPLPQACERHTIAHRWVGMRVSVVKFTVDERMSSGGQHILGGCGGSKELSLGAGTDVRVEGG